MAWLKLGAMLGVFALSLCASTFPTLSKRLSFLNVPQTLFFVLKHFGTGVILSTAFVHLLQDAFEILLRLPDGSRVKDWVGLIVLAALLAIFLSEYVSMAYVESLEDKAKAHHEDNEAGHHHSHFHIPDAEEAGRAGLTPKPDSITNGAILSPLVEEDGNSVDHPTKCGPHAARPTNAVSERTVLLRTASTPCGPERSHVANGPRYYSSESAKYDPSHRKRQFEFFRRKTHYHPEEPYTSNRRCESGTCTNVDHCEEDCCTEEVQESSTVNRKHVIVNTLVLQAGIMIHSLIIGLTLSIKSGPEFTSLMIAILFHQLFEGLSLGVRLASLDTSPQTSSTYSIPIVLATIFAVTVPAGCLIGRLTLGVGTDSSDSAFQLAQGLTSALSAGTLIYASGVELLAGDFLHSSLRQSSIWKQVLALVSLAAGVASMAALAAFD